MAAMVENGLLAAAFPTVLRHQQTTHQKLSYRPTGRSCPRVSGSSFKTKSSLSSGYYAEQSKKLTEVDGGGPPRWFSPLECGCSRSTNSPLLLFLPGIDGSGHGLTLHHERLGEIFDVWCLHIPVTDRTPLADLVKLVQSTVRSEHNRAAKRPIYLVGESFGASLALVVAAQNPDIDLVLILANPATSLSKSLLQNVVPLWDIIDKHRSISSIPVETILWKLNMINEMQNHLNSNLRTVDAQTLILNSGKDILLSSITEQENLRSVLKRCEVRSFIGNGDPLFLDDTFDLAAAIKRASYYRRGRSVDFISDFMPPSPSEFDMVYDPFRWMDVAVNPVMLSTLDNGKIIRGLSGIPSEGPVLFVGNHMMLAMDLVPLVSKFVIERNITVRTMAHPLYFERLTKDGKLPDLSFFDVFRVLGAVPVTAANMYKLFKLKSHVLLFPGGIREGYHRKGEDYKLIWPVEPEFVRMAVKFGAKIVPFGGVGEDDVLQLLLDSDDQMKIPPLKSLIEELTNEAVRLRTDAGGEVGKQLLYYPIALPKLPGRFYFLFGKPIPTAGREDILRNKDKAKEMYLEIQNEIDKCIVYLKEKREKDPYRNLLARLPYQGFNGFDSQVPTFDI
ncbi:hypothetical protein ABFS82_04G165900 [Erythranthe guttata]|uniref:acyltransferase-like protein At3g26840, chloroplastic n=1 Tax=Erythranthe guttata TaxID=4155 RepID=UPI00064DAB3A|nr:PREDICTED: acyltransferase-like protein At3g26840, chloroplastic [Erythranthe guttata]|eukprot:XP_012846823.1 PREDICTED: acyltransferase-like protein At3g26840, chloroplastic [Erythranthe guttata]